MPEGPASLLDRGLLVPWYVLHRLDEEMERSRRRGHQLAIVVLQAVPLLDQLPNLQQTLQVGAAAAREASRVSDLIGWLGTDRILIVLPDTDKDGAASAVWRWRENMRMRSWHLGTVRWNVAALFNATSFTTVDELLESARVELRPAA